MIDPLYLQNLPKVFDDNPCNANFNIFAKKKKWSPRRTFSQ